MSDVVEINYEHMDDTKTRFAAQAEEVKTTYGRLTACLEDLKGGGWIGDAANSFFQEMDNTVLPAMQRLEAALQSATEVSDQVSNTFHQAEEEASSPFRNL